MAKPKHRTLCAIFSLLFLFSFDLSGQSQFTIKDILDKNAGLTQRPLCMLEDREGFFWIGTEKGLFRFDGSRAREVRFAPEDSLTDPSRKIFTLLLDQTEEFLWIGTGDGIFKYQLHSGKSEKLAAAAFFQKGDYKFPECRVLFQDRQGELWANFAVPGLVHLQDKGQSTEQFTCTISPQEDAESMGWGMANSILCIVQDPVQDSILWAGTRAGLIKFNKETRTIRHYYFFHPEKYMRPKVNAMLALFAQADRKLYIGTYNGGLLVFDPNTEQFEQYLVQPEVDLEKTRKNGVVQILAHSPEELWISQPDKLFRFHTQSKQFTEIRGANGLDFMDRAGNYWDRVGAGLELFHRTKNQIQHLPFPDEPAYQGAKVLRIREDSARHTLFVRTEGIAGLPAFDRRRKQWELLTFPSGPETAIMGHILEKTENGLLANDKDQFYFLPEGQRRFEPIALGMAEDPGWMDALSDPKGNLFISGNRGYLFWLKPGAAQVQSYYRSDLGEPVPNHFNALSIATIDDLGRPWFVCAGGFSLFLPDQNRFLHVAASLDPDRHFTEYRAFGLDRPGRMWCLGPDGIGWLDPNCPEEGLQQRFEKNNGFPLVELGGSLTADKNGRFWFSSHDQDLIRFDPEKLAYSLFEGIGARAVNLLAGGELAFVQPGGIGLIHPDSLRPPAEQPKPYIAWLKVFDQEVPLPGSLLSPPEIRLGPEENFISIGFSALGFYNPEKNRFAYQLEGVDKDWVHPEPGNHIAGYTDLSGGHYVFRLKVANSLGIWSETPLEWHIQVATPWWETGLFRLLVLSAGIGLLYVVFQLRLRQQRIVLQNQQLLLEKEISLRNERDRIAAEMHDDLGAGLSTIRFLSLLAKEKEDDTVKAGRIDKIARSAAEVMEKMADIIWVMNSRNDSLESFAGYFRRYAGEYLDTHGIQLIFELPDNLPALLLSGEQRRSLLLALKECLHNVVKHAAATELHLQISLNGHLEIILQDNGKGFPSEAEKYGNGLSNIYRRMEALGGTARFENGNGVKVTLKTGIVTA